VYPKSEKRRLTGRQKGRKFGLDWSSAFIYGADGLAVCVQ
jgi:hypothetical protein